MTYIMISTFAIYDTETPANCLCTGYQVQSRRTTFCPHDVQQVQAYAHARTCSEAVLIYPVTLSAPVDIHIRDIRVRGLVFSLTDNLEDAGQRFLNELLNS